MAVTERGIYYNDDPDDIADVEADMKELAESVEQALDDLDELLTGDIEAEDTKIDYQVGLLRDGKVDKVSGKGLSTNDYDNTEKERVTANTEARHTHSNKDTLDNTTASYTTSQKNKLTGIEAGAQVNVIETVKVNNTSLTPTSKAVNITVPTALSNLSDDTTHRVVTDTEKSTWNGKYVKPSGGIPKTDLDSSVQTSLDKADSALQTHQDITGKEDKSNKVTSMSSESTDTQYPSAKVVYDELQAKQTEITELQQDNTNLLNALPEVTGEGSNIILEGTSKNKYKQPPLPGGNSTQVQLTGKNLLPTLAEWEKGDISPTTGNISSQSYIRAKEYLSVLGNTQYFMSFKNTYEYRYYILQYDENKAFISYINDGAMASSRAFTTDADTKYIRITLRKNPSDTNITTSIISDEEWQLEQGSTATDYEPYCGGIPSPNPTYPQNIHNVSGDVEVAVISKNLLNIQNASFTDAITATFSEDGFVTFTNITNNTSYIKCYADKRESDIIKSGNSYTLKVEFGTTTTCSVYLQNSDNDYSKLISTNGNLTNTAISNYMRSMIALNGNTTIKIRQTLVKGSEAPTTYTPHAQQTLPFTLSQGQKMYLKDYLADDGIHHVRGEVVLNGNNGTITIMGTQNDYSRWRFNQIRGIKKSSNFVCDKLQVVPQNSLTTLFREGIVKRNADSELHIILLNSRLSEVSVNGLNEYLSQNPFLVEYELAEEVIDPYTTTQQEQYNAIKKAISYKDTTIITLTSDDADPLTNVVAVADMSNALNIINARLDLLEE